LLQVIHAFGLTSNPRKAHPPAVDDISFEAREGHVTVLLGGDGAGKTTALRLMLELQQGRGITYFRGRPLHRIPHPAREVGVLLGDVPGHPARSVRGHLRMLCAASGVPARRADEVLEAVGLVSLREERLGTLSRGMDRRLGLACALLPDPHTLVLDEPTDGLSAREAQWVHGMLRAHADQGGTVLFTSADPKEAARTADRVVTLDGGRVVADQDAREFARTRLRPRVAVRSPHAARLAVLLTKEARTARRSVEVVREGGNRLSVYGSTTADIGEAAFRHGILIHQLADEVGDMGPGAGGEPDVIPSGEEGAAAKGSEAERDRVMPGSPKAEPETTVSGVPAKESGAAVAKGPELERDHAMPGSPKAEPGMTVGGLQTAEPETAVRGLRMAEWETVVRLSAAESGAPTIDSSASEQTAVVSDLSSAEPGVTAPGLSAREPRERGAVPFGFSVENRESGAADTSALQRAVPSGSLGEEQLAGEEPSSGERAQAHSGEVPSSEEAPDTQPDAECADATHPASTEGASPGGPVAGTSGSAPNGVGLDGEDAPGRDDAPGHEDARGGVEGPGGVDTPIGEDSPDGADAPDASDGADGEDASNGGDAPGEGRAGAGPVEVLVGAGGGRSAEATIMANAGRDMVSGVQEPQAGSANTPAGAINALRARLPGARNPRTRQPHAARTARPDPDRGLDTLPPLPPSISVRPAPSPLRPLRYEIRRATGIGVGFLTCGAVLVVSALTAVLLARLGHTPQARLFAAWPRELPLPPAAVAAGLLGALAFGDEFRHPALAADRGTVPRRLGLLTAKLLVSGATAALLAFLTVGCDAEALYIIYGRELTQVPADWLSLSASWFGLVVGCAWAGVLAAGVFRSTTGGLASVLAVPVVVVPLVHKAMQGPAPRMAAGFPVRMREVHLLQWPFGGDRYLLGLVRVLAQPVGVALVLSLSALLCAYVFTTLRTRLR
jgi:ABC-type multidrug transport system ATPase subunit